MVSTLRSLIEVNRALMMRTQSRQKNTTSASAVATCANTRNARYGESLAVMSRSAFQLPPMKAGRSIEWPRLDMGNSSVTPWTSPMVQASR